MNIAINPETPEYRLSAKLIPVETTTIKNKYEKPLMSGNQFVVLSVLSILIGVVFCL